MAAKPDAKEATEAPAADAAAADAPARSGGGIGAWLPAIIALVLSPAATWAVANFVLIPKLQAKLGVDAPAEAEASHGEKEAPARHGSEGERGDKEASYTFENVVVNLAGTMGTRYLKASFVVTGAEAGIKEAFEGKKAQLTDITLNVLSSLTLADLEQPGAKNVLRERLVAAYNQALGRRVAEQVYFSDFVIQ